MIGLAILGGALVLPSCGGDDDPTGTGGTGGKGGKGGSSGKGGTAGKAAGGSAGKATGGSAGKASGGSAGSTSTGGSSGSSGEAGETGSGGGAGTPGSGGSSGEAGSGGTGGSSAGESGAAGEAGGPSNPDPQSTACSAFPETVMLGETIALNTYGAVLCAATSPSACRLTTNTYSDGVNPCAQPDRIATFLASTADNSLQLLSTWHITSTTAGTVTPALDYSMTAIPDSTSVTATIESPDGDTYSLVFEFGAGRSFTITSFTETT
jgi:hypothetical protein